MYSDKDVKERVELLHKNDEGYRSSGNWHFVLYLIGLIAAVLAIRAFVFEPIRVDGESMQNTLQDRERCFAEKVSYLFSSPKQGDIVIVYYSNYDLSNNRSRRTYVKRVVATAGQTVCIAPEKDKGTGAGGFCVYIDGEPLDESAYSDGFRLDDSFYRTIENPKGKENSSFFMGEDGYYCCTVPEGYVFVMGDHRTNSHDRRASDVGPIPLYDVIGKVRGVMYPFSAIRPVK